MSRILITSAVLIAFLCACSPEKTDDSNSLSNAPRDSGSVSNTPDTTAITDTPETRAIDAIAIKTFEDATGGRIKTYEIVNRREDDKEWTYFIRGTGEYMRPGYDCLVKVDKKNRSTRILWGK